LRNNLKADENKTKGVNENVTLKSEIEREKLNLGPLSLFFSIATVMRLL
jgi:hypothetical protein